MGGGGGPVFIDSEPHNENCGGSHFKANTTARRPPLNLSIPYTSQILNKEFYWFNFSLLCIIFIDLQECFS